MALEQERPLQIAGAINAYAALLGARAGFRALYLSGAGVANHSCGIPDIGDTTLADVLVDARRIAQRVALPLLVDIDTGWDDPAIAVRELAAAGVASRTKSRRKNLTTSPANNRPAAEMLDRVRAAVRASPTEFVVMARTDATAVETPAAIARARRTPAPT